VDGERARQQPEAGDRLGRAARARHAALEPAHRARAQPGEDGPALPRLGQDLVEPVRAPDRKQVAHRAAAAVDDVGLEHDVVQRPPAAVQAEQRQLVREAGALAEAHPERRDLGGGVARRRRQEQDSRLARLREREHEVVERRVVGLHREPASAHGEDDPAVGHAAVATGSAPR
jgi:hypothetical protein